MAKIVETAVARCKHGALRYLPNDKFVGMSLELYGEFSDQEGGFLEQLLHAGQTVVEVGANIGAHTVHLAHHVRGPDAESVGSVIAFEPQRAVHEILAENLRQNGCTNAIAMHAAVGSKPGVAMVPDQDYNAPGNFGGVEMNSGRGEWVPVMTIDSLDLPALALLKIDCEGMEAEVLEGARETIARLRPILYVENDRAEKSSALITLIQSFGYRLWWHLPPLFNPQNARGNQSNIFPGIVSINMVCVPREREATMALCEVSGPDDDWHRATAPAKQEYRPAADGQKKCAVVRPGAYGDMIWLSSILPHLKSEGYHVTVYTEARGEEVLRHDPHIDGFVRYQHLPMAVLIGFWDRESKQYDRVINLTESVEKNALSYAQDLRYYWPDEARRKTFTANYLENTHLVAGVPANPGDFRQRFYASDAEKAWARAGREAITGPVAVMAVSGSSPTKYWPHSLEFAEALAGRGMTVVMVGDLARIEREPASERVRKIGTEWPIRHALAFAQVADIVIGQETGLMNAVAMEDMPKVVLLTHSAPGQLTKHWRNTVEISGDVPCYPCHRIHHHFAYCQSEDGRTALCQTKIDVASVLALVDSKLGGSVSTSTIAPELRAEPVRHELRYEGGELLFGIPTWNRGDRLAVAIRSICEQIRETGARARVLVCDNASTDSTPEVVAELRREFPGLISYHRHAFNYGGAVNFRTIFGLAEYEWLWLMGDDDFLAPDGLKTMLPLLQDAKEDFYHVAEVPRCSNTGIHRGTLFELCNRIGWLEMTGFMSSLVMRGEIAKQIFAIKNWPEYRRTSYLYGCALLEVAAHRRAALVDLPIVDLQDRVQTPETLKRWAATDHDQGYRRVCEALGLLRDAGAIPGRVNPIFFRYVTYHLWDRFITQHLAAFGRTGKPAEEIEWQRIGHMIDSLEPEAAAPVQAAVDLARSAMDVDPEKDRDALVKRLNALIESHSRAVYPYTYLAQEAGELLAA